jgi:hypothetical protein
MMTYMGPSQAPQGATAEVRAEFAKKPPVAQPVIVAMRLKFDDKGKITEAEHLLSGVRAANMANLKTPRAEYSPRSRWRNASHTTSSSSSAPPTTMRWTTTTAS